MPLTLQELSEKYNISPSSITSNFTRTKETIAKKYGVTIEKIGRGKSAVYQIVNFAKTDPNRAVTLYQSTEKNPIPVELATSLSGLNFITFLGIIFSPQRVFRGSLSDMLKYLEVKPTPESIAAMRTILQDLNEQDYIMYMEDRTDPNYFMAGVLHKTETDLEVEIGLLTGIKQLVEENKKTSWVSFFKTFLAVNVLDSPVTIAQIAEMTGLSEYKARECLKFFSDKNLLLKSKNCSYNPITKEIKCHGQDIDLNAIKIAELSKN